MKRSLSLVLLIAVLASVALASFPSVAVTHGYLSGDANDDGNIDMKDVLTIRRYIALVDSDRDISFLSADIDRDEHITMRDTLRLQRTIAGDLVPEGNNTDGLYKVGIINIGSRNISRYTIVYPERVDDASIYLPSAAFAATELQKYIEEACGIKLNIAYDSAELDGYKIKYTYDYDGKLGLDKEGYAFDVRDDGDLVITCGTMRGAIYATYGLLEDFIGYRFLTGNITYLYNNEKIDIPCGYYDCQTPTVLYRSAGGGSNYLALRINASDGGASASSKGEDAYKYGGAVGTTYLHAHSFVYYMAGWENREDPTLNSIGDGKQPCMTDEATYDKILDFMRKFIEFRKDAVGQVPGYHFTQVSCSANDNGNYCTCENCKAVYYAEGSIAGALIRLCNRVADEFLADYPMLDLYTCAYAGTNIPPKLTAPDPRICVCFCNVGCNNHLLRHPEDCDAAGGNDRLKLMPENEYGEANIESKNGPYMKWLQGWLEMTDNVWFWYYVSNWIYYISPAANLFNFYDDIKYMSELGVKGYYLEVRGDSVSYNFETLRKYLMDKMMWHPEMTEEEYNDLMDEFLFIYYGDGWESIKEYIYMSDTAGELAGCWTNNFDYPWDVYSKDYFRDHYHEMTPLFDSAYDSAESDEQRKRVKLASLSMDFLGLSATYGRDFVNGDDEARTAYLARYRELWNYYNEHREIRPFSSGWFGNFPSSPNDPVDTMTWLYESGTFTGTRK
ncbi:MAG: DUF4838 domain-containing protein [Clostridia bacterium]|nr:DUF4838 domain-containing protein [Clostridia bacterium]